MNVWLIYIRHLEATGYVIMTITNSSRAVIRIKHKYIKAVGLMDKMNVNTRGFHDKGL